jgi:hypothetical protein
MSIAKQLLCKYVCAATYIDTTFPRQRICMQQYDSTWNGVFYAVCALGLAGDIARTGPQSAALYRTSNLNSQFVCCRLILTHL